MSIQQDLDVNILLEDLVYAVDEFMGRRTHYTRITKSGLFIKKESLSDVVSSFNRYFKKHHGGTLDEILVREQLLLLSERELHYLAEPQRCMVGYLIPTPIPKTNMNKLRTTPGHLSSCRDNLVIDDPLFKKNAHIKIMLKNNLVALFRVRNTTYSITNHAFNIFIERVRKLNLEINNRKYDVKYKRNCLNFLYQLFKQSKPMLRKNAALQIIKFDFKEAIYYNHDDWIFVVGKKNNYLLTCYPKEKKLIEKLYKPSN